MSIPKIAPYSLNTLDTITNKVNWQVKPDRAALLVHDMQNYFLNFYDQSQDPIPEVIKNIKAIMSACRNVGIPVYFTAQPGDQDPQERALLTDFWGPGLKADPALTAIHSELTPQAEDTVLAKWRYSAFVKSDFKKILNESGRDQLLVVGVYAHIGCMQTIMEAFMNDIQGFLIENAVADFSLDEHNLALNYIAKRAGRVLSCDQLIKEIEDKIKIDNLEGVA